MHPTRLHELGSLWTRSTFVYLKKKSEICYVENYLKCLGRAFPTPSTGGRIGVVANTETVVVNTQTGQIREPGPQIVWIDDTLTRTPMTSTGHHRKPGVRI